MIECMYVMCICLQSNTTPAAIALPVINLSLFIDTDCGHRESHRKRENERKRYCSSCLFSGIDGLIPRENGVA